MNNRKLTINWGGTEDTNIPTMQPRADRRPSIKDQARSNVFTRFRGNDTMIENQKSVVSSGMWSTGTGELTSFYTSSTQSGSTGQYFYDVYHEDPSASTAAVQFAVSYGDYRGSGSVLTHEGTDNSPSKAMYSQMAQVFLPPSDLTFDFDTYDGEYIYSLVVQRARLREKMDPGNWELELKANAKQFKFIDDSGATTNPKVNQAGRVFNIVSGSIEGGIATIYKSAAQENTDSTVGSYGLFYPDMGVLVFNGARLDKAGATGLTLGTTRTSGVDTNNAELFVDALNGAGQFLSRREEKISSTHFFCRVPNKKYNFSNNPTFFTASDGAFTNASFHKDPKTYITTVGLYNNANELLAVAKLSQPLLKSYSREAIIKVRLDF